MSNGVDEALARRVEAVPCRTPRFGAPVRTPTWQWQEEGDGKGDAAQSKKFGGLRPSRSL
jgi:hypothetical protein